MSKSNRSTLRVVRHTRIRKRVSGTAERPRLAVYRSLKHISVQLIDDTKGHTLVSASSTEAGIGSGNQDGAMSVGKAIAERAKAQGITAVVFDRGGFRYHGRVAKLAEAAREGGLEF